MWAVSGRSVASRSRIDSGKQASGHFVPTGHLANISSARTHTVNKQPRFRFRSPTSAQEGEGVMAAGRWTTRAGVDRTQSKKLWAVRKNKHGEEKPKCKSTDGGKQKLERGERGLFFRDRVAVAARARCARMRTTASAARSRRGQTSVDSNRGVSHPRRNFRLSRRTRERLSNKQPVAYKWVRIGNSQKTGGGRGVFWLTFFFTPPLNSKKWGGLRVKRRSGPEPQSEPSYPFRPKIAPANGGARSIAT